jgi:two-component system chemotaxis response regulator CheB
LSYSTDRAALARKIRVMVVDDSALIRKLLTGIVGVEPDMQVVGAAPDPIAAREMIRALNPDVITLDVEMPKMDGLVFLERLMRLRPTPVVMVSGLTEKCSEVTLRALELGAVDFVAKPKLDISRGLQDCGNLIADKIRAAAASRPRTAPGTAPPMLASLGNRASSTQKLILIGASTGGTEAIRQVLTRLPPDAPGVLITQHMPEGFTRSFAQRLDALCRITVSEAVDGERVLPGHAYIAPGHSHLRLRRSGAGYVTELSRSAPVNRHRPSVDVLFRSAAQLAGRNAVGVMLTGMGRDGAAAMREMHDAGAWTIAQDEASCVVFGMPREAIAAGGVDEVVPLDQIAARMFAQLAKIGAKGVGA